MYVRQQSLMADSCQPPCEAVSWNRKRRCLRNNASGQPPCEAVSWNACRRSMIQLNLVSLLVRLWVEMYRNSYRLHLETVSLLVRLWVEITVNRSFENSGICQPPCEAVSWNNLLEEAFRGGDSQPPCEAVSWNISMYTQNTMDMMSASLWGCELK